MTPSATPPSPPGNRTLSSRGLLRTGALMAMVSAAPHIAWSTTRGRARLERSLELRNTYTGEFLRTVYWADGRYVNPALKEVNRLLRDHYNNETINVDPRLLDILHTIFQIMEVDDTVDVISGYRSPETNAMLRRTNMAIAKDSLHTYGKAVDIRIPGVSLAMVRRVALALEHGGVGYYPRSNFLHLDTGPVRSWSY